MFMIRYYCTFVRSPSSTSIAFGDTAAKPTPPIHTQTSRIHLIAPPMAAARLRLSTTKGTTRG